MCYSLRTMDTLFSNVDLKKLHGDISPQARTLIHNVFLFLNELKSDPNKVASLNFNKPREMAAFVCGVSRATVDRIKTEVSQSGSTCIPRTNFKKPQTVTNIDDFDKSVLKRTVASFYENGEYPSVAKILEKFREQLPDFKCGNTSMRILLKEVGFQYKKNSEGRKYLMERTDIVCARMDFLRKLDLLRRTNDQRPRFYLDETWINQNHARKRMWLGSNDEGGFKNQPVGKGQRLIVCHAGSARTGFVPDAKLIFKAVKSKDADYHTEMDGETYMAWFSEFLNLLEEPSVIIVDNASYHSIQLEKIPTRNTRKAEIQEWLTKKKIPYSSNEIIEELIRKVKASNPQKVYALDHLANERGHEVIRLPPYHCQYNPIELIWAQVKGEVAKNNNTFKIADVENHLHRAIENVTREDWAKCVRHAEELQNKDLQKALIRDHAPLIINLAEDEDSDDEDSDED